jgi:hypothetical protein
MPENHSLAPAYQTGRIIGYAMAGSLLVYAGIVEVFKSQEISFHLFPEAVLDKLRFVCVFLSFAGYFLIKFCRQQILTKKPDDTTENRLTRLALANIVSLALAELPAFFGLLLFLNSGNSRDFYLLGLISLLLLYAFFPHYPFWAGYAQAIDQTPSS